MPPRTPLARNPRRLLQALLVTVAAMGLLGTVGMPGASGVARAATVQLKAVIIVGPTGSLTTSYKHSADAVAAAAAAKGMAVTKLYTPNATWANVKAATAGANLVYFAGHGNGFPNPYVSFQPLYNDGYGLDPSPDGNKPTYYGEQYVAGVKLAPGAIVLLNHLCYAPGASEPGNAIPSQPVAIQRVDDFAAGFLAAGASAVFSSDDNNLAPFVDALFSSPDGATVGQLFGTPALGYNGKTIKVASTRTPGTNLWLDPSTRYPWYYGRSMAGNLGLTVADWRTAQPRQPAPSCPSATTMPALTAAGDTFLPLGPTRILDTRSGTGLAGPFVAGLARTLPVAGIKGVPQDAVAVTVNVTTVHQTDAGYVSLTPSPAACPATSTLNFPIGDVRANVATVPLDANGNLSATYMGRWADSSTDLVMDVTGAFVPSGGARYEPLGPTRLLDTRPGGTGLSGHFQAGIARTLHVQGVSGVPKDATAVTVNLTVVGQSAGGYLSLTTSPTNSPATSTLNFPKGDIRANGAIVPLSTDGSLSITYMAAPGATTDAVMDLTGAFVPTAAGTAFTPLAPTRILDTRSGVGLSGAFSANDARRLQVTSPVTRPDGVPAGATSVTVNITVVGQTAAGYLSLTAKPTDTPVTSSVNFPPRDIRANGATVPLASDGSLGITYVAAPGATTQVVIDITGYSD
ncbi:MAG: hypothetical protein ACRDGL_04105 [Candidatus Limnocylindrales bacterium]